MTSCAVLMLISSFVIAQGPFVFLPTMSSLDELCSSIFRVPEPCEGDRIILPARLTDPLPKIGLLRHILDISAVPCSVVSCLCVWVCCCV